MKNIKKYLKKHLSKERYQHTLGVAYTAAAMAMKFNPDTTNSELVKRAELAGLLHDCAKNMSDKKKLQLCDKNNIPYSELEAANAYLLHGKVGALIAKSKFQIQDEDILNSIIWHTTGRPGMSDLEKIIFIADYIEPARKPVPKLDIIRKLAFEDLDKATAAILENTITYLKENNKPFDSMTQETYNSYKRETK